MCEGLRNITERTRENPARRRATSSLYPGYAIVANNSDVKARLAVRPRERWKKPGPGLSLEEEVHKV